MTVDTTPETTDIETSDAAVDTDAEEQQMFNDFVATDNGDTPDGDDFDTVKDEDPAMPEAKEETTPEPNKPADIWADAPEPLRSAYEDERKRAEKLDHAVKSTTGRESALQRKLNELQAQLDAAQTGDADSKKEATKEAAQVYDSQDWQAFESEYPEIAGPIKAVLNSQVDQIKTLKQQVTTADTKQGQIDQQAIDKTYQDNLNRLAEAHPEWEPITESTEFATWIGQQPRYVQDGFNRNAHNIVDPAEAIDMIQRFKDQTSFAAKTEGQGDALANDGADGKAKTQAAKRSLQLQSSTAPRAKGAPPVTTGVPEDDEAAFAYYVAQDAKKAAS